MTSLKLRSLLLGLLLFTSLFSVALAKNTSVLHIHHRRIIVEVASTLEEREKGLMLRKQLPLNHGMLFVFPDEATRYFWMKNTLIPLDIAFLDKNGKILTLKTLKPLSMELAGSEKPARYALEVNAGVFEKMRLRVGEKLTIPRK